MPSMTSAMHYNAEPQDAGQYNANHLNLSTPGAAQFQLTMAIFQSFFNQ